jgi:hypothetical protein
MAGTTLYDRERRETHEKERTLFRLRGRDGQKEILPPLECCEDEKALFYTLLP